MRKLLTSLSLFFGLVTLNPLPVIAAQAQTDVVCSFSHMKPDDPIMMFGKPGMAMSHDFFGNRNTDAFSTVARLLRQSGTTCNNTADSTGYWAPTMKLPDGEIVHAAYMKMYYQADDVANNPLTAFPHGIQLLAGDHDGTAPNSHVNFLCANGKGYTNKADQICGLRAAGDAVQFNVGVMFPNCWDGKNLKAAGTNNAVYSINNKCPANYPVKLATVNMNIAYVLPQIKVLDVSKIQFSLDPEMINGLTVPRWGSPYTAHGDFMNAWTDQAATFMTERCMNYQMDCEKNIPYSYTDIIEDTYISNHEDKDKNFHDSPVMLIQDNWDAPGRDVNKQSVALLKFTIPPMPTNLQDYPGVTFTYKIRIWDGNITDNAVREIYFYPTDPDAWREKLVTWDTKPPFKYTADGRMQLNGNQQFRYVTVDKTVLAALAAGKTEISYAVGGERKGRIISMSSKEGVRSASLMLIGYQAVKEP